MFYRIYTDDAGVTRYETIEVDVAPRRTYNEVLEGQPVGRRNARSMGFHSQAAGFFAPPHRVERPVFVINVSGELEYGLGDGTTLRIGPSDAVLFEDFSGTGHTTRVLGDVPRLAVTVELEAEA